MRFSRRRLDRKGGVSFPRLALLFAFLLFFVFAGAARADWSPLIQRLVDDRFDEKAVRSLFAHPDVQFDPRVMSRKVETLVRKRSFKPAPRRPGRRLSLYRECMNPRLIDGARTYLRENRAALDAVRRTYGVPKEIIVSILLVETRLGECVGERRAFNTLASMARCTDLETIRPYLSDGLLTADNEDYARRRLAEKSAWAYKELKALMVYAEKGGLDPLRIPGSFYGAIGICQFMPSHAMTFGVDADQDGRVDLFSRTDAFHSIGNYLRGNGWKSGLSRGGKHRVIRAYNPSRTYANTVLAVADRLTPKAASRKQPKRKSRSMTNPA